jgi:hypothetical protein
MPFVDELRDARKDSAPHPWRAALQNLRGQVDRYGVERVGVTTAFEYLDAVLPGGFPHFKWTPLAARKVKALLIEFGWTPVRGRQVISGRPQRVRGYARDARSLLPMGSPAEAIVVGRE